MIRDTLLSLARAGHRMPIGTDLVLYEEPDPENARLCPERLGRVIQRAALRYRTPLAFPLMDLRLEKSDLLSALGVPAEEIDAFHFSAAPPEAQRARVLEDDTRPFPAACLAQQGAIRYIASLTELVPIGMAIGPFSLMTKLLADPITPLALAASGLTEDDDSGIRLASAALDLALATVLRSLRAQAAAGARAVIVCEPAISVTYLSPRQMARAPRVLDRFVLDPLRAVRRHLDACGEPDSSLLRTLAFELRPAMLSLGSSRRLWEDAALVPEDTVLYGNLPTRQFYSDAAMPVEQVRRLARELIERMRAAGRPFILGSECDVLHVPEAAETIRRKVDAMLEA